MYISIRINELCGKYSKGIAIVNEYVDKLMKRVYCKMAKTKGIYTIQQRKSYRKVCQYYIYTTFDTQYIDYDTMMITATHKIKLVWLV